MCLGQVVKGRHAHEPRDEARHLRPIAGGALRLVDQGQDARRPGRGMDAHLDRFVEQEAAQYLGRHLARPNGRHFRPALARREKARIDLANGPLV